MARVLTVQVLREFEVELVFSDGSCRVVDLRPRLEGPLFGALHADPGLFGQVRIDEFGGLVWPNGADICPDLLHRNLEPA